MKNKVWVNKLLPDERSISFQPQLAVALGGADEALVLWQLHYWLNHSENEHDGYVWVYNSYSDWQENFLWLSEDAIRRIMRKLKDAGLVITANYNKSGFDRTIWYRIDYDKLEEVLESKIARPAKSPHDPAKSPDGCGENAGSKRRKPETNTKVLPKKNQSITPAALPSNGQACGSEETKPFTMEDMYR